MSESWTQLAARAGINLTAAQIEQLAAFLDRLGAANATMNLTRIVDRAAAEVQHIGDALTLLGQLPPGPFRLADVGSGGGVPGIPLAIVRPDAKVLLIESTRKKAAFLEQCAQGLGLENVTVTSDRAETVGRGKNRETFDVAIARAVGSMAWVAEWCLPLVRVRGCVLAMKGQKAEGEIAEIRHALKRLGGGPPKLIPADLPGTDYHVIVRIEKIAPTDLRYPRDPTHAKGKPMA